MRINDKCAENMKQNISLQCLKFRRLEVSFKTDWTSKNRTAYVSWLKRTFSTNTAKSYTYHYLKLTTRGTYTRLKWIIFYKNDHWTCTQTLTFPHWYIHRYSIISYVIALFTYLLLAVWKWFSQTEEAIR